MFFATDMQIRTGVQTCNGFQLKPVFTGVSKHGADILEQIKVTNQVPVGPFWAKDQILMDKY